MTISNSLSYAIDLMADYKTSSLQLTKEERRHMVGILLLESGEEKFESIYESIYFDDLPKLMSKFIFSGTDEDKNKIIDALIDGASDYFDEFINKLLEEARYFYEEDRFSQYDCRNDDEEKIEQWT